MRRGQSELTDRERRWLRRVCSDVKQSSFEEGAVIKKSPCNEFIPSVYVNVLSLKWDTR